MNNDYAYHEYAQMFPMMSHEELLDLSDDIFKNGLQYPIELYENKILDGRNRFEACILAEVDPEYVEWVGDDPRGYVLSVNLHRRHLTESQRAMIAARYISLDTEKTESEVEANLPQSGRKSDVVGEALNVSGRSVRSAKKVLDRATPAVQEAVDSGRMSVSMAAGVSDLPKKEQNRIAKTGKPKQGSEVLSATTCVDQFYKQNFPKLVRGIDEVAKINGGKGPMYRKADKALNEFSAAVKEMRKGKK